MSASANTLALDLDRIEDNYDAIMARLAVLESAGHESFPFATVERICDGENALRVWREYRSLSVDEVSEKSALSTALIQSIESDAVRDPPFSAVLALSKALDIDIELVLARPSME